MDIVIDTSALIAVIVGKPERKDIIELTKKNFHLLDLVQFLGKLAMRSPLCSNKIGWN